MTDNAAPDRIITAHLADRKHQLPMPAAGGRLFSADGEQIDSWDPFWIGLLKDGSIVAAKPRPADKAVTHPPAADAHKHRG